nr:hypothetical protein [Gordonia humi]
MTAGSRLKSQACTTQIIVVKAGDGDVEVRCGGHPMIDVTATGQDGLAAAAGFDGGTVMGKRYVDAADTLEVLVTKNGAGSLSVSDDLLEIKSAKPLPSSD